jgi:ubiquinone/menaquinone biosynthesis C-methylase UbiE
MELLTPQEFFQTAYRTGSDIWTHIPYHQEILRVMPSNFSQSLVLDVGSGRGLFAFFLGGYGSRVLGIDYIPLVVHKANEHVKYEKAYDQVRFMVGDALSIPFTDASFDIVTDIGMFHYLPETDRNAYIAEIMRVLKPGGYFVLGVLSKETPRYLGFYPKQSDEKFFEKFGIIYYYFTPRDINDMFLPNGFIIEAQHDAQFTPRTDPGDKIIYTFTRFRKK